VDVRRAVLAGRHKNADLKPVDVQDSRHRNNNLSVGLSLRRYTKGSKVTSSVRRSDRRFVAKPLSDHRIELRPLRADLRPKVMRQRVSDRILPSTQCSDRFPALATVRAARIFGALSSIDLTSRMPPS